ncbi:MAG: filamentous hemagglutinin N-terminal domain-containing protein [Rhabdochlamydiaceae bacterium]|nr:filamentous hemagglutinin N-terminal domain-containing protein [Rhabdochlamydiaceae bacterium]
MRTLKRLISMLSISGIASVYAMPTHPSVLSGNMNISSSSQGTTTYQCTSDRTIIDWDSFSLDPTDHVFFQLPSTTSAVLNRVVGTLPSELLGQIQSNGTVYFVNAEGIVIGTSGSIQTTTFLASTLNPDDQSFLFGGDITFIGTTQNGVDNQGTITATTGDAVILGFRVSNEGKIFAKQGQVSFGSGQVIILNPSNQDSITILVPAPGP